MLHSLTLALGPYRLLGPRVLRPFGGLMTHNSPGSGRLRNVAKEVQALVVATCRVIVRLEDLRLT